MQVGLSVAAICAAIALSTGGCASAPVSKLEAAPSPLCALNVWRGLSQVRLHRFAQFSFGGERPRPGPELAAACAAARGPVFTLYLAGPQKETELEAADLLWLIMGYRTASLRGESSFAGLDTDPDEKADPEWDAPHNAFDLMSEGQLEGVFVLASTDGKCSGQAERCVEISMFGSNGYDTLQAVRVGGSWRLLYSHREPFPLQIAPVIQ